MICIYYTYLSICAHSEMSSYYTFKNQLFAASGREILLPYYLPTPTTLAASGRSHYKMTTYLPQPYYRPELPSPKKNQTQEWCGVVPFGLSQCRILLRIQGASRETPRGQLVDGPDENAARQALRTRARAR